MFAQIFSQWDDIVAFAFQLICLSGVLGAPAAGKILRIHTVEDLQFALK